jgi:hypothetical protein
MGQRAEPRLLLTWSEGQQDSPHRRFEMLRLFLGKCTRALSKQPTSVTRFLPFPSLQLLPSVWRPFDGMLAPSIDERPRIEMAAIGMENADMNEYGDSRHGDSLDSLFDSIWNMAVPKSKVRKQLTK